MKNLQTEPDIQELTQLELINTSGGNEPDDLAYNITYALITTNPFFWLMKYNSWVYDQIAGN